jgi:deoxycytidine triphosphate deaminase
MARILADKEIRTLIGSVLMDADVELLNPNGIELRLGKHVLFHSTGEEKKLQDGDFLKVSPGENVVISSIESIDFSEEKVQKIFPHSMLMGIITPTTTMMREGISQAATKIDAGFRGTLNWGLRNSSMKDVILKYGEPIFKITVILLEENETPEMPYGERAKDEYQDTQGVKRSTRRIPADIPKSKIVSSTLSRLDPKKQLKEAGYPFDHIGTELIALDGKFEIVSRDVALMKDEFHHRTSELSAKMESETSTLSRKIEESHVTILDKVEALFDRKFLRVVGVIVGAIPIVYGGVTYLQGTTLGGNAVAFIAVAFGIVIFLLTSLLARGSK